MFVPMKTSWCRGRGSVYGVEDVSLSWCRLFAVEAGVDLKICNLPEMFDVRTLLLPGHNNRTHPRKMTADNIHTYLYE